jgi:hypothetical protein
MGGVAARVVVCANSVEGKSKAASSKARNKLSIVSPDDPDFLLEAINNGSVCGFL